MRARKNGWMDGQLDGWMDGWMGLLIILSEKGYLHERIVRNKVERILNPA